MAKEQNKQVKSIIRDLTKDGKLIQSAANLSFATYPGIPYYIADQTAVGLQGIIQAWHPAGIAKLEYVLTPGVAVSHTDAMNWASKIIYAKDRSTNSGASNYESADFVQMLFAPTSLITLLGEAITCYGLLRQYDSENRNVCVNLLETMGWDYDACVANKAQFLADIQVRFDRMNSLMLPADFPLYKLALDQCTKIYCDSNDKKASLYVFVPKGYHLWNPKYKQEVKSTLEFINRPNKYNPTSWCEMFDRLFDPMVRDSDTLLMQGDIKKSFGEANLAQWKAIDETYVTPFEYNHDVLTQIHNADLGMINLETLTISQNNGYLEFKPRVKDNNFDSENIAGPFTDDLGLYEFMSTKKTIIDVNWRNPSPEDVVSATRYKLTYYGGTATAPYIQSCGSVIIDDIKIRTYSVAANSYIIQGMPSSRVGNIIVPLIESAFTGNAGDMLTFIADKSNFAYFPIYYLNRMIYVEDTPIFNHQPIGDLDNYTLVEPETIKKIQEAVNTELWNISKLMK